MVVTFSPYSGEYDHSDEGKGQGCNLPSQGNPELGTIELSKVFT